MECGKSDWWALNLKFVLLICFGKTLLKKKKCSPWGSGHTLWGGLAWLPNGSTDCEEISFPLINSGYIPLVDLPNTSKQIWETFHLWCWAIGLKQMRKLCWRSLIKALMKEALNFCRRLGVRCLARGPTWQDGADNSILQQKSKGEHPPWYMSATVCGY